MLIMQHATPTFFFVVRSSGGGAGPAFACCGAGSLLVA